MEKIKICYVIVNCKVTGPMNQTLNIIKYLNTDRFEVSLITLFKEEEDNTMLKEYKEIIKKCYCLDLTKFSSLIFGRNMLDKKLKEIKPDVIHALGMPPFRLSLKYKKAKHLVTLRNYAYEDYPSYYNKFIGPILAFCDINLIKKLNKKGEYFITCSKSLSIIYEKKEKIKLDFIRNGVDTSKFIAQDEKEIRKVKNKK